MKSIIDLARHNWHKPVGLVFAVVGSLLFISLLLAGVNSDVYVIVIAYGISTVIVLVVWCYANRLPKTPKGKVGFVVSIQCSDEDEYRLIREDFVTTLRLLLKDGIHGKTFHFIELPKHLAETVNDTDDAIKLRIKTGAIFVIYGRVRLRTIEGKECHILDLEGAVGHRPLPKEISKGLATEFSELFPRKVHIAKENDLFAFNFTSEWTQCVAKYIIAIAASYSYDLVYAERLYEELREKLCYADNNFPIYVKLRQRVPKRLSEIYLTRAMFALDQWRDSHSEELLQDFSGYLQKIGTELSKDYGVLLLMTIEAFLVGRNIKKALRFNKKCKMFNDPIWHFNLAFLKAYQGYLGIAIRQYRICSNYEISAQTMSQVKTFCAGFSKKSRISISFIIALASLTGKSRATLNKPSLTLMHSLR